MYASRRAWQADWALSRSLAVDSLVPRLSLVALAVVVARDALRCVARWSSVVLFHLSAFFFSFHARWWRVASFDRLRVVRGLGLGLASCTGETVSHDGYHLDRGRLLQFALYRFLGALGHRGRVRWGVCGGAGGGTLIGVDTVVFVIAYESFVK